MIRISVTLPLMNEVFHHTDDLDRLNNSLQALALQQFVAGVEVTAVRLGDVQYHRNPSQEN